MIYYIVEECGLGVADMGTTEKEFITYLKEQGASNFNTLYINGIRRKTNFFDKEDVERLVNLLNRCMKKEKYLLKSC